ncbi:putative Rossmann-fold nucleotide-binding protein [Nitrobacteraceae bacterium AZCC 2146]
MSQVTPRQLYSASDLLDGFNPWDPMGYMLTRDFSVFRQFVTDGGPVPASIAVRMSQAEHDAGIADALRRFLSYMQRPLVGVMGGHGVARNSDPYRDIAYLTRTLARKGFLLVTGGGPGVMEAAHLGVAFSSFDDESHLEDAISILSETPYVPVLDELFEGDGTIKESKLDALVAARDWLTKALKAREMAPAILPVSLAIPTWLYGAEPTMPFATHYAKYFQNSLREEALINNSRAGIVYGRGGGGTMREIFQDVERNYYAKKLDEVTPMIFFDRDDYWRRDADYGDPAKTVPGIKLDVTVRNALEFGLRSGKLPPADVKRCLDEKLRLTNDVDVTISALQSHAAASKRNLNYALAAQPMMLSGLRMNRR